MLVPPVITTVFKELGTTENIYSNFWIPVPSINGREILSRLLQP
jgi:hypothetical protein